MVHKVEMVEMVGNEINHLYLKCKYFRNDVEDNVVCA